MPSALPPVTDCGCSGASSSGGGGNTTGCCALTGLNDPNADGIIPQDITVWTDYWQLADLVNGPVIQTWYWNPHLLVWQ